MSTYRARFATVAEIVVTVEGDDEDTAYDDAVQMAKERLEQIAATINGVAVHADIDGVAPDEWTSA